MYIEKIFSEVESDEKLYSVLLSEDEYALFSEFQKEFTSLRAAKNEIASSLRKARKIAQAADKKLEAGILSPREQAKSIDKGFKNILKSEKPVDNLESKVKKNPHLQKYLDKLEKSQLNNLNYHYAKS